MTQWQAFPLRPPEQPWAGLNTKGGVLDDGRGWLEDGSVNAVINEADILEKRPGFIRGLDERFDEVVCGLFTYIDDCGIEWLLVADRSGIYIRQPFDIPVFELSDAYPADSFEGTELDTASWRNTAAYTVDGGSLVLGPSAIADFGTADVAPTRLMRWFKGAASPSYQVTIQYAIDLTSIAQQTVAVAIKGNGDLTAGARLQVDIKLVPQATEYVVQLKVVSASGSERIIQSETLKGFKQGTGFLKLSYSNETRVVTATATPNGGAIRVIESLPLTVVEDAGLGQVSAIGIAYAGAVVPTTGILQVSSFNV
ncbi:MAG TPA: hypothetical protein VMW94_02330 [Actinomycetes bacterium]|nr:hypothetical protein [Actinomycetes bacterium]